MLMLVPFCLFFPFFVFLFLCVTMFQTKKRVTLLSVCKEWGGGWGGQLISSELLIFKTSFV